MASYAPKVYRALHGVFCVYKPPSFHMTKVIQSIQVKLTQELNSMEVRPPRQILQFTDSEETSSERSDLPTVTTVPDLADHPLVVGKRYVEDDFLLGYDGHLRPYSSGLVVFGIGAGRRVLFPFKRAKYVRVYHVQGQLGLSTADFSPRSRTLERTTFRHVTHAKLDRVIAAMQAGHQKHMFVASGVDLQSEEAYELAVKGLIRPTDAQAGPTIYSMKCIDFSPPYFMLEIHAINDNCTYFMEKIHQIGLHLKTGAVCTQLRRIRFGHFTLRHALLHKQWDAHSVIDNIKYCRSAVHSDNMWNRNALLQFEEPPETLALQESLDEDEEENL